MYNVKDQNGFSLIEIMTALFIGTIILGVAVPTFMTMLPTMRVNSCASNIANNMQWARMRAVSENNPYFIAFDTAGSQYVIYDDNDNNGANVNEEVKRVNISDECTGINFGFPGVTKGPDPDDAPPGSSVTFKNTLLTNLPNAPLDPNLPAIEFSPGGTLSDNGAVYLAPSGDTTWERVRAIQTFTLSGKTSVLQCSGSCTSAADWT